MAEYVVDFRVFYVQTARMYILWLMGGVFYRYLLGSICHVSNLCQLSANNSRKAQRGKGNYIMIDSSIQTEDLIALNRYIPNIRAPDS